MHDDEFSEPRQRMLEVIAARTVFACVQLGRAALRPRVMAALAQVPRHEFVPLPLRSDAYADNPVPIGFRKTVSQPFIVAVMTDLLDLQPTDTVLEVGTGSGYQTAILAQLAQQVYSVELIDALAERAGRQLARLGLLANVTITVGNGWHGWPEHAPFDKVIVAAAPEVIPPALIQQLKPGGKMVIPAGPPDAQQLILLTKDASESVTTREIFAVRFSPLER